MPAKSPHKTKPTKQTECPCNPGLRRAWRMTVDELELWVKPVDQRTDAEIEQSMLLVQELIVLGTAWPADELTDDLVRLERQGLPADHPLAVLNAVTRAQYDLLADRDEDERCEAVNCQLRWVQAIVDFKLRLVNAMRSMAELDNVQKAEELYQREFDGAREKLLEFANGPDALPTDEVWEPRTDMYEKVRNLAEAKAFAFGKHAEAEDGKQRVHAAMQALNGEGTPAAELCRQATEQHQVPDDLCTVAVARSEFIVTSRTIRRYVKSGKLHDYRPSSAPINAPRIFSRAELSKFFIRK